MYVTCTDHVCVLFKTCLRQQSRHRPFYSVWDHFMAHILTYHRRLPSPLPSLVSHLPPGYSVLSFSRPPLQKTVQALHDNLLLANTQTVSAFGRPRGNFTVQMRHKTNNHPCLRAGSEFIKRIDQRSCGSAAKLSSACTNHV